MNNQQQAYLLALNCGDTEALGCAIFNMAERYVQRRYYSIDYRDDLIAELCCHTISHLPYLLKKRESNDDTGNLKLIYTIFSNRFNTLLKQRSQQLACELPIDCLIHLGEEDHAIIKFEDAEVDREMVIAIFQGLALNPNPFQVYAFLAKYVLDTPTDTIMQRLQSENISDIVTDAMIQAEAAYSLNPGIWCRPDFQRQTPKLPESVFRSEAAYRHYVFNLSWQATVKIQHYIRDYYTCCHAGMSMKKRA